jgi:hypothetical protein
LSILNYGVSFNQTPVKQKKAQNQPEKKAIKRADNKKEYSQKREF